MLRRLRELLAPVGSIMVAGVLVACGGGAKPAEPPAQPTPPSAPATTASAEAGDEASGADGGAPAPAEKPSESDAGSGEEPSRLSRSPREILTGGNVSFSYNFNSSDVFGPTEQRCKTESAGDPKANADCMRKAREKVGVQVHRFAEKNKQWWWSIFERRGNQLVLLHRYPIEFGAETKDSITIRPTGKDQGLAPMPAPREVTIKLPNEYSIEIEDPKQGRMVFDAKIGLVPP